MTSPFFLHSFFINTLHILKQQVSFIYRIINKINSLVNFYSLLAIQCLEVLEEETICMLQETKIKNYMHK